jgi:hypothetical protein
MSSSILLDGHVGAGGNSAPPQAFLCPITQLLMEHPVTTANGNTFEYSAISRWLASHDTDPATNEVLPSKALSNALLVRSLIRDWAASNPDLAEDWRNDDAKEPPKDLSRSEAGSGVAARATSNGDLTNEASLGKVLSYKGTSARPTNAQRRATRPPAVVSNVSKRTYEFGRTADGQVQVRLASTAGAPATEWMLMPDPRATTLFETPQGLVFFDPEELHEVRTAIDVVAEGTRKPCKFQGNCTNNSCKYSHPFACRFGVKCRNRLNGECKFLHPDPSSVVPLGDEYPLNQECKYSTACTNKGCHFAHPCGRLSRSAPRVQKLLYATHNPDLSPIVNGPVALDLGPAPAAATHFSFQGEFVFFYTPYPGAWAKEHFRTTTVHRFDRKSRRYQKVGDYALDGHYCNAAVGSHQYFLLSWWPYEDEAMRAHWEAERQLRAQGKSLRSAKREVADLRQKARDKDKALASRNKAISNLTEQVKRKNGQIVRERKASAQAQRAAKEKHQQAQKAMQQRNAWLQAAVRRKDAHIMLQKEKAQRQQAEWESRRALRRQREEAWSQQRRAAARNRNERFRLLDPIHVYALAGGKSGTKKSDWHLVLDYHKGAHRLELSAPFPTDTRERKAQRLKVTEGDAVFEFDLVVPEDLAALGQLPIVPGRLCEGF